MSYIVNIDTVGKTQVTQVGFDFVPSSETNAEINRLMGYSSGVYGGKVLRNRSEEGQEWEDSPDYINDAAATLELLEIAGVAVFVLPAHTISKSNKINKKKIEWIGAFALKDEMYVTLPMDTEAHAVACVWWFLLSLYHYIQDSEGNFSLTQA